jgi:hypothetical protein
MGLLVAVTVCGGNIDGGADGGSSAGSSGASSGTGGMSIGSSGGGTSGTSASPCPAEEKLCGGTCVNAHNPSYGCGLATCESCAASVVPHVAALTYTCVNGACVPGPCPAPYINCDVTKPYCDTNPNTDPLNCGNCANAGGNDCTAYPAGNLGTPRTGCVSGLCKITSCAPGYADCNGVPADGCEVQLSASNCWSCPPPGSSSPPCPCRACYVGPGGLAEVCPACMSGSTCNTTTRRCE